MHAEGVGAGEKFHRSVPRHIGQAATESLPSRGIVINASTGQWLAGGIDEVNYHWIGLEDYGIGYCDVYI